MSYLDDFRTANTPKEATSAPTIGGGSYLDKFKAQQGSSTRAGSSAGRLAVAKRDAATAEAESQRLNSLGGFAKSFLKDLFIDTPKEIVKDTAVGTFEAVKKFPGSVVEDVKAGAEDIEQGKLVKGIVKSGFRVAGDTAITLFSPLSSAIGAVLTATGGQKLVDEAGQVIADKSGITDMEGFQKFAMNHPNAAEDFDRLLFLTLIGKGSIGGKKAKTGEKGELDLRTPEQKKQDAALESRSPISPERMFTEAKMLVEKLKQPKRATERKLEVKSETGETPVSVKTPQSAYRDYLRSQGYEPYVPDAKLPVIDAGKGAEKSKLPTIEAGDTTPKPVAPIPTGARLVPEPAQPRPVAPETTTTPVEARTQPATEAKPIAERIETPQESKQRAVVEEGFAAEFKKETKNNPETFKSTTFEEQRTRLTELTRGGYETAVRMLTDIASIPEGIVPSALYKYIEAYAKTITDINKRLPVEKALTESRIRTSEASKAGQALSLLREKVFGTLEKVPGAADLFQLVRDARTAKLSAKEGAGQGKVLELRTKELEQSLRELKVEPARVEEFIRTIRCN